MVRRGLVRVPRHDSLVPVPKGNVPLTSLDTRPASLTSSFLGSRPRASRTRDPHSASQPRGRRAMRLLSGPGGASFPRWCAQRRRRSRSARGSGRGAGTVRGSLPRTGPRGSASAASGTRAARSRRVRPRPPRRRRRERTRRSALPPAFAAAQVRPGLPPPAAPGRPRPPPPLASASADSVPSPSSASSLKGFPGSGVRVGPRRFQDVTATRGVLPALGVSHGLSAPLSESRCPRQEGPGSLSGHHSTLRLHRGFFLDSLWKGKGPWDAAVAQSWGVCLRLGS